MSHGRQDVSASLIEELDGLSSSTSRQCIDRVNDKFRIVNRKVYEPELVAIGPYNHHSKNLEMMEEYKKRYTRSLITRVGKDISTFVDALRLLEPDIRACYAECLSESEDHLTKMMVLDGCFIIELLKRFDDPSLREEGDRIFRLNWMLTSLQRDLLLFENQLPFIVLCKLHDLIVGENCHELLVRAGIRIEKNEGTLFEITFKNKTLKIPPLIIKDRTDSILRNIITYEQYDENYPRFSFVSDHVKVLDCLIHSPKDVEILRQSGIIVIGKAMTKQFQPCLMTFMSLSWGQARGAFTTSAPSTK